MRRTEPDLHGLIVVDKPPHLTSHDIVARIRRLTGIKRVGHAGTLDPFATGVVVVAVGRATRVLQYVQDTDKQYLAHVVLGAETDSADVDGRVVARDWPASWPSREVVEEALAGFIGAVEQIPPVYSAIKVGGKRLYREAREGRDVEAPVRSVTIHAIELVEYQPPDLILRIACGKGTYIRSIARDLGRSLGTFGYCHGLMRTATGGFCLAQAWSLDELEEIDPRAEWHRIAIHPDAAVAHLPAALLSETETAAWYHGQSFAPGAGSGNGNGALRIYGSDGHFLGVGTLSSNGILKPDFVFAARGDDVEIA